MLASMRVVGVAGEAPLRHEPTVYMAPCLVVIAEAASNVVVRPLNGLPNASRGPISAT
jgi:hypothetical protein